LPFLLFLLLFLPWSSVLLSLLFLLFLLLFLPWSSLLLSLYTLLCTLLLYTLGPLYTTGAPGQADARLQAALLGGGQAPVVSEGPELDQRVPDLEVLFAARGQRVRDLGHGWLRRPPRRRPRRLMIAHRR
jgi:hypothetical protein